GAGFGKVSSRASEGDAGGVASLCPSNLNSPARFRFVTATSKCARRRLRSIAATLAGTIADRRPRMDISPRANRFGTQIIGHSNLNMERRTSNVQYRMGSWISNLRFQIAKIEQA